MISFFGGPDRCHTAIISLGLLVLLPYNICHECVAVVTASMLACCCWHLAQNTALQ